MAIQKKHLNTMLGQISVGEDYIWDAHVHLWGCPYHSKDDPDLILKDQKISTDEVKRFKSYGGDVLVEYGPLDFGRDYEILKAISQDTGIHILAGTGFYRSEGLEELLYTKSEDEWIEFFIDECTSGERKTGVIPSFLKWSTSLNQITKAEKDAIKIIAAVHKKTKLPVATHTQRGTMVTEQIRLLHSLDVDFSKLVISHIDMRPDLKADDFLEVLNEGAYVSFDQLGKPKYGDENHKIDLILELCNLGYSQRILLATDIGRLSNFKVLGGSPGIEHIPAVLINLLRRKGADETLIKTLVNYNPSNFYGI